MANLPSRPTASLPSLQERAAHREWIGGRAITLLSHYWRDDDPVELTAAIGKDWADVLEGIPQEFLERACVQYLRENPDRKPKPGNIYQLARAMMPAPRAVIDHTTPMRSPEERCSPEAAAEILSKAGFKPRRLN